MESIIIALVFLWLGFVGAISFMESWLKFKVKEVSLPIGLSIGRKVFGALNKVEIVISIIIFAVILAFQQQFSFGIYSFLIIAISIVLIQTLWFLPSLNKRVDVLLKGEKPKKSSLHLLYISSEITKTLCLLMFGLKLI